MLKKGTLHHFSVPASVVLSSGGKTGKSKRSRKQLALRAPRPSNIVLKEQQTPRFPAQQINPELVERLWRMAGIPFEYASGADFVKIVRGLGNLERANRVGRLREAANRVRNKPIMLELHGTTS
ncbi:unnamed protein product, partial [Amoebophrya sp. A25]|eukprot:GSA25T00010606001.1